MNLVQPSPEAAISYSPSPALPYLVIRDNKINEANPSVIQLLQSSEERLKGLDIAKILPEWPFKDSQHSIKTLVVAGDSTKRVSLSLIVETSGLTFVVFHPVHQRTNSDDIKGNDELQLLTNKLGNGLHLLLDACEQAHTIDRGLIRDVRESYRHVRATMAQNRGVILCKSPEPIEPRRIEDVGLPILVVDDQLVNRRLIMKMLQQYGFVFEEAENGLQAVEMIKAKRYSLIFLDIIMPVMGGRDACRAIRTLANGIDVPIIAASSELIKETELGPTQFTHRMVKPFDKETMLKILKPIFPSKFIN